MDKPVTDRDFRSLVPLRVHRSFKHLEVSTKQIEEVILDTTGLRATYIFCNFDGIVVTRQIPSSVVMVNKRTRRLVVLVNPDFVRTLVLAAVSERAQRENRNVPRSQEFMRYNLALRTREGIEQVTEHVLKGLITHEFSHIWFSHLERESPHSFFMKNMVHDALLNYHMKLDYGLQLFDPFGSDRLFVDALCFIRWLERAERKLPWSSDRMESFIETMDKPTEAGTPEELYLAKRCFDTLHARAKEGMQRKTLARKLFSYLDSIRNYRETVDQLIGRLLEMFPNLEEFEESSLHPIPQAMRPPPPMPDFDMDEDEEEEDEGYGQGEGEEEEQEPEPEKTEDEDLVEQTMGYSSLDLDEDSAEEQEKKECDDSGGEEENGEEEDDEPGIGLTFGLPGPPSEPKEEEESDEQEDQEPEDEADPDDFDDEDYECEEELDDPDYEPENRDPHGDPENQIEIERQSNPLAESLEIDGELYLPLEDHSIPPDFDSHVESIIRGVGGSTAFTEAVIKDIEAAKLEKETVKAVLKAATKSLIRYARKALDLNRKPSHIATTFVPNRHPVISDMVLNNNLLLDREPRYHPVVTRPEDIKRKKVALFLDVSGSMSSVWPDIIAFCWGLSKHAELIIHQFSTDVVEVTLDEVKEGKLKTYGGTCVSPVVDKIVELSKICDSYVIVGDRAYSGRTTVPKVAQPIKLMDVCYDGRSNIKDPWFKTTNRCVVHYVDLGKDFVVLREGSVCDTESLNQRRRAARKALFRRD